MINFYFMTFSMILCDPLHAKSNTLSVDLCSDSTAVRFRYLPITTANTNTTPSLRRRRMMNKQQIWLEATCCLRTICQQNHLMCGLRNGLT